MKRYVLYPKVIKDLVSRQHFSFTLFAFISGTSRVKVHVSFLNYVGMTKSKIKKKLDSTGMERGRGYQCECILVS